MADSDRRYLFEYRHEGAEWALELVARDVNDAKARLAALPFAAFMGEIATSGPIPALTVPSLPRESLRASAMLRLVSDRSDS